jgi:hypothetical protein
MQTLCLLGRLRATLTPSQCLRTWLSSLAGFQLEDASTMSGCFGSMSSKIPRAIGGRVRDFHLCLRAVYSSTCMRRSVTHLISRTSSLVVSGFGGR